MLGCGDAGTRASAAPEPQPTEQVPPTVTPTEPAPAPALELSIEGWPEAIGAKAQLNVTEGVMPVRLEITGGGQRDIVLLDVGFVDLAGSMGPHRVEAGLPGQAVQSAIASLGGQPYHSQAGQIDVTLSSDGSIAGSFDLALVLDPDVAVGEPIVFEPSDDVRDLKGQFSGRWELFCQSHMPGHASVLQKGGDYCDALEF
jgi:hypothetical protein